MLLAPVAVVSAATAAVVSILLLPALAVTGAYELADPAINYLYTRLNLNKEEVQVKHSYSILPPDSDEYQESPKDVLHFDSLFHSNTSTGDNVIKRNALGSEEITTRANEELRHSTLGYSTSSDET
ncbi:hypothetical protein [Legionella resiliens]|uniref:Uncharacterized protein n=1 Tax=Legionella resiliens TaxID=2905958 RepID=A0ABS8X322_9GAMM|nr:MULTISPECIES: hypothetical protein [unclassified Legionella]MCE0722869.1 hypothetical protein [Legionella sp. 9fVS26]MCE3532022.1 hypothetical protein [Legionella sp. 8cVS16]